MSNTQTDAYARAAWFLLWSRGMTSIPRDSDILKAAAVLAIVLVTGLFRAFGL